MTSDAGDTYIAVGKLIRLVIYLFLVPEGMLGGEGGVTLEDAFIENAIVLKELLEHRLRVKRLEEVIIILVGGHT